MNQSKVLASRFREVTLNGTWIANTNFRKALEGSRWEMAVAKAGDVNTVAVLTQHIHYYIAGILNVFNGGALEIRDAYSFDFAPIESQAQWEQILDTFFADAEAFASAVERLTDAELEAPFVDLKYGDYKRNIDGMIEHAYYHLGQILLLQKLYATTH